MLVAARSCCLRCLARFVLPQPHSSAHPAHTLAPFQQLLAIPNRGRICKPSPCLRLATCPGSPRFCLPLATALCCREIQKLQLALGLAFATQSLCLAWSHRTLLLPTRARSTAAYVRRPRHAPAQVREQRTLPRGPAAPSWASARRTSPDSQNESAQDSG
jgi:hypothetical protein